MKINVYCWISLVLVFGIQSIQTMPLDHQTPGKRFVLETNNTIADNVYVRLVGGHSCHEGRVELFAFNTWGTVCSDFWGSRDAAVICHMLGFSRNGSQGMSSSGSGIGSGVILLDNVNCSGTESSITHCPANKWGVNDCSHLQDAAVACNHSTMPDGFLLFTDTLKDHIYRMDLATGNYVDVPMETSGRPVAIDYDPNDRRIYWTDVALKKIFSISIDARSQKVVKSMASDSVANGLAVDHISQLLFYADTANNVIYLMSLNGTHERVVANESLNQPRSLELDPVNGILYWTAWGIQPTIECSNYDGTNRTVIVDTGLGFPNGLALDLQGRKLYWTDEKNENIEGVNMDGTGRHTVYQESESHMLGLAYFMDELYFTDMKRSTVMKVSVTGGEAKAVGPPGFDRLNDIHVHKTSARLHRQNGCSNGRHGCPGLCFPTANGGRKCI